MKRINDTMEQIGCLCTMPDDNAYYGYAFCKIQPFNS